MSSSVRLPTFRKSDRSVCVFRGSVVPCVPCVPCVPWFRGSVVPWFRVFRGSVVTWFRGSVVPWLLDRRLALQPYQVTDFNSSMVLV